MMGGANRFFSLLGMDDLNISRWKEPVKMKKVVDGSKEADPDAK